MASSRVLSKDSVDGKIHVEVSAEVWEPLWPIVPCEVNVVPTEAPNGRDSRLNCR